MNNSFMNDMFMIDTSMHGRLLKERFRQEFGYDEGLRCFFAPGRVNLIGEHTDYNGGYVFPAALTYGTWAVVSPRKDGVYRFRSTNFEKQVECDVSDIQFVTADDWANYPKGVLKELLLLGLFQQLTGADMLFHGNIPIGTGLSSSASIELVTLLAITKLESLPLEMIQMIQLAQRAENQFIGVNCGIMDQFIIGLGKKGNAIRLKCDTLDYQYVPLQFDGYKLVVTNSNKKRGLADSKYNQRRSECEQGLRLIQNTFPMVTSLGELPFHQWKKNRHLIEDERIRKRVEHVVSENERVLLATKSLQEGNLLELGRLMMESHLSLRDDYEVTGIELDTLFEEARKMDGCIGTRMTGAGFGGCSVSLVKEETVERFKERVSRNYAAKTGLVPTFYICDVGDGAKEITEEVW